MTSRIAMGAAYAVSRRVLSGEITPTRAARTLNANHGLNENSARDLISGYKHLMRGEVFHRALSAPDMDFYLSRIRADSGAEALRVALRSFRLHIAYYEGIREVRLRKLRQVANDFEATAAPPEPAEVIRTRFDKAVKRSMASTPEARAKRLARAPRKPARIVVISLGYARNPDVVAEVLARAKGVCERCHNKAPFNRERDGTPYLEVHHKLWLALEGDDTVANAEALCPNCHRELHHGV